MGRGAGEWERFSWTMGLMSVSEITKVNFGERGGGVGEVLLDNGADVRLRDNKGKLWGEGRGSGRGSPGQWGRCPSQR